VWIAAVVAALEEPRTAAELPLAVRGTAFQERVWAALRSLRPGERISYGELARRLGAPRAVRAVARACGENPVAVLVPCHRVVGSDGALRGYRWGLERKRALLEREAVDGDAVPAPEGRKRRRARMGAS
jgi:AraC family transcriptional regulator of adaptative response/methylated-DNA-[protein]-cysteine methyltransferase